MQAFVDLVGGIVGSIQKMILVLIGAGILISIIIGLTITATAPVVADEMGERAERFGDKAIKAAREEQRAEQLAEDGWGYGSTGSSDDDWGE